MTTSTFTFNPRQPYTQSVEHYTIGTGTGAILALASDHVLSSAVKRIGRALAYAFAGAASGQLFWYR